MWTNSSHLLHCIDQEDSLFMSTAFSSTRLILLTPVTVAVVLVGHQRWRRQRSFASVSPSDLLVYHKGAVDVICTVGSFLYLWAMYSHDIDLLYVGMCLTSFDLPTQMMLHMLTCVERYLAVVHPVTYLTLKQSQGVRMVCMAVLWLHCGLWILMVYHHLPGIPLVPFYLILGVSLVVVTICSFQVLRALVRPGPGDVCRDRVHMAQSKQRAFNTITAIAVILWFHFGGIMVGLALDHSGRLGHASGCLVLVASLWVSLPSYLVLPVLFLHRSGKLPCCPQSSWFCGSRSTCSSPE